METITCNICGADETELIAQKGQFNMPLSVVICKKCGLSYLNPRWERHRYMCFYEHEYDAYYRPAIFTEDEAKQAVNPIIERLRQYDMMPRTVENVLDIGSGEGRNLTDVEQAFPHANLYAIEPSRQSQKRLQARGYHILSDDVDSSWEQAGNTKFDLIIMRHVLEHFFDPQQVLKRVSIALNNTGVLYLAVPNNLHPKPPMIDYWFRAVHTFYFNKYSIYNLLCLSNLETTQIIEGDDYNQHELYVFAKKGLSHISPEISPYHYQVQYNTFKNAISNDNSIKNKFRVIIKKMKKRITH